MSAQSVDPYKDHTDNVTQSVLVVQLFLTLFLGLIVAIQESDTTMVATAKSDTLDVRVVRTMVVCLRDIDWCVAAGLGDCSNQFDRVADHVHVHCARCNRRSGKAVDK